jgi:small subunit ribosomal protein S19
MTSFGKKAKAQRIGEKKIIKTWQDRRLYTDFVGHTLAIHNGKKFLPIFISDRWLDISLENSPYQSF